MHSSSERTIGIRLVAGIILLVPAAYCTWLTIDGLRERRDLRMQLAELSHVRYGLLNADIWVSKLVPILNTRIDALDLQASDQASLRPTVEHALYRLLDQVKEQMSKPAAPAASGTPAPAGGGLGAMLGGGNPLIVNMIVGALRPHVPEYADVVLKELGRPENKQAVKEYIRSALISGAKATFGNVDRTWYNSILQQYGCKDAARCDQELNSRIHDWDQRISTYYLTVLAASALALALLLTGAPMLRRPGVIVMMLFCLVLLAGGILTPMLEVEARLSSVKITFMGEPVTFADQLLYFQSKSVLEVFHTLVTMGRPEMWFVGVLVLTFSVVFPALKILSLSIALFRPPLLRNPLLRFLALGSSKWSMADVMALAIFMAYVAFNGLISNTLGQLQGGGAQLVIPTNSSKILPGYYLFIGFCLASLFLSKKLERGIKVGAPE